jgi:hypothetical protein
MRSDGAKGRPVVGFGGDRNGRVFLAFVCLGANLYENFVVDGTLAVSGSRTAATARWATCLNQIGSGFGRSGWVNRRRCVVTAHRASPGVVQMGYDDCVATWSSTACLVTQAGAGGCQGSPIGRELDALLYPTHGGGVLLVIQRLMGILEAKKVEKFLASGLDPGLNAHRRLSC